MFLKTYLYMIKFFFINKGIVNRFNFIGGEKVFESGRVIGIWFILSKKKYPRWEPVLNSWILLE